MSLVSPENYSKVQIMELFSCTKHKVDMARKWRKILRPFTAEERKKALKAEAKPGTSQALF